MVKAVPGTFETLDDVRSAVATGGIPDMGRDPESVDPDPERLFWSLTSI